MPRGDETGGEPRTQRGRQGRRHHRSARASAGRWRSGFAEAGADDRGRQPQASAACRAGGRRGAGAMGRQACRCAATSASGTQCQRLDRRLTGRGVRAHRRAESTTQGIAPVPVQFAARRHARGCSTRRSTVNLKGPLRLDAALAAEHMPAPAAAVINVSCKACAAPVVRSTVAAYAAAEAGLKRADAGGRRRSSGRSGIGSVGIVCGTFHTDSLHKSMPTEGDSMAMASSVCRPDRIFRRNRRNRTVSRERRQLVSQRRAHCSRWRVSWKRSTTRWSSSRWRKRDRPGAGKSRHDARRQRRHRRCGADRARRGADSGELPAGTLAVRTDVSDPASVCRAPRRRAGIDAAASTCSATTQAVSTFNMLA